MAFRRNRSDAEKWAAFLSAYQDRLTSLGIPTLTLSSPTSWHYFIEHGYDFAHPDLLNMDDISPDVIAIWLPVFEDMHTDGYYAGANGGVLAWLRAGNQTKAQQAEGGKASPATC